MFGMMFGDVGHGAAAGPRWRCCWPGPAARAGWPGCARPCRSWPAPGWRAWSSGALYGEFFGPTGVAAGALAGPAGGPDAAAAWPALGVGAVLLAGAYALGTVNRCARGRLALRAVRPVRVWPGRRSSSGWGCSSAGSYGDPAGWCSARRRGRRPGPGAGVRRAATPGPAVAARASRRPPSSCSTWWSASAPTSCRFARLAAFGLTHAALGVGGLGRHRRRCGPRGGAAVVAAVARLPRRQRPRLRAGGAGRRRAGAAAGVLRAVLPGVRGRGPPVPAVAPAAGRGPRVGTRAAPLTGDRAASPIGGRAGAPETKAAP